MIRIMIVEDQSMLRDSLTMAVDAQPDMEVVSVLADAADVTDVVERTRPDCILMDVCTDNDSSGIVAARLIKGELHAHMMCGLCAAPEQPDAEAHIATTVDFFIRAYAPRP